ncbi:hypothetical protein BT96DRAFT_878419 [Gymnopus androsaceus JB14]|uniref:Uncharacterized protein n=1 Tax=Gymnopus androsaceus JB14 TaxID=1447944 RepID=A0A6A4I4S4_9AGAR|nr:hypothetical protein BT96DRAFT_878419 [Gymnopus androsaceus JB14]
MSGKKTINAVFLYVDDDAIIKKVSGPAIMEPDMFINTASTTMKSELQLQRSALIFFHLDSPIRRDDSTAMMEQLGGRFDYDWKQWKNGRLQTIIDSVSDPDNIYLVALYISEFERLPPREWSSELPGGKYFSERPAKAPSTGAEPAEFAAGQKLEETRIYCDRPRRSKEKEVLIPLALLFPSFGAFQTNIRTIEPSDAGLLFATRMSEDLCGIFDNEDKREAAFRALLGEFLGVNIPKEKIGDFTTDGAVKFTIDSKDGACTLIIEVKSEQCGNGDPGFQVALNYLENSRIIRHRAAAGDAKAASWMRLRLPSILITHPGPSIQILGGVMNDRPQIEVLTACVPMSFHASNQEMLLDLARTLTALHILFTDLGKLYDYPPAANPSSPVQHSFPYPRSFKTGEETTSFTYVRRVDATRLVFEINTEHNEKLFVKYARQYGERAHRKAYEIGLAPKLLACDDLEGGWKLVVMASIPADYEAVDDIFKKVDVVVKEEIKSKVREALEPFFEEGFIHGDLRPANIFFDVKENKVLIIDYDWAGSVGAVKYPPNVRCTSRIWRPEGELSLRPIILKHDREMVEHLYPMY